MAETIVNLVVGKLAEVLSNEVLHLYSVNEQVEKVSRELQWIQVFLKDADRKKIKDEGQKHWVKEVRDVAHSIEDAIDTFLMEIPQNPQKSGKREAIKNMFRKTKKLPAVHNLVNEINQILKKMKEIEESRVRYGINNLGEGSTGDIKLPIRPTVLPDIDPDIIGFKADQDYIVKELLDETTTRRSVVSICGTGGLGKTILARKVYNCSGGNTGRIRFYSRSSLAPRSRIFSRQWSRALQLQWQGSGPSSYKDGADEFPLEILEKATKFFSLEMKIGAGSFGTVYRGLLPHGREVAIKHGDLNPRNKRFQEKEDAFQSELAFLSRLNHKHLVSFIGFCVENDERLLVYAYMKNGALHDHLHPKDADFESPVISSWKMRIKILLDASRGIEYLHNYAVPPIIHRDIKSSNILLDANWVARVSDFGLSLTGPNTEEGHLETEVAGTVGYMDPEYYGTNQVTVRSDVYGFGVVMLEVLTGKRAIYKIEGGDGEPLSVVDYAVPKIQVGEVGSIVDSRVVPASSQEAEALELIANVAIQCVSLQGRERPTIADVVVNLETALAHIGHGQRSVSSTTSASIHSLEERD